MLMIKQGRRKISFKKVWEGLYTFQAKFRENIKYSGPAGFINKTLQIANDSQSKKQPQGKDQQRASRTWSQDKVHI